VVKLTTTRKRVEKLRTRREMFGPWRSGRPLPLRVSEAGHCGRRQKGLGSRLLDQTLDQLTANCCLVSRTDGSQHNLLVVNGDGA
jgi:hypothetical protein